MVILQAELLHGEDVGVPRTALDECAASAERKLRELSSDPPAVETTHRRALSAAEAILDAVAERKVGLIITGTHGCRGLSRLVRGSTAKRAAP